jgi:hypothetical protein
MSNVLRLSAAIATYGHTKALKDKQVQPAGAELDFVEVEPIIAAFRRQSERKPRSLDQPAVSCTARFSSHVSRSEAASSPTTSRRAPWAALQAP